MKVYCLKCKGTFEVADDTDKEEVETCLLCGRECGVNTGFYFKGGN